MAMTLVSTVTVGSGGAASIEFTGIPATGKDLLVLISTRSTSTNRVMNFRLNNDTGSNYDTMRLIGQGSSASSSSFNATSFVWFSSDSTDTTSTFDNVQMYLSNYTSSAAKSISLDSVSENNNTTAHQQLQAIKYSGTSAITSIQVYAGSSNALAQHSTASLYIIS